MDKLKMHTPNIADENFRNGDYAKAVKSYEDILGQFPEAEESIGALSNLAESWLNLWQVEKDAKKKLPLRLSADAVEGYLAERFSGLKESFISPAGDAVLRLAAKERDLGALARSQQLYEAFFDCYPTHYNAALQAFSLGARAVKQEDWELAARFYGHIANLYTNHTSYASALQKEYNLDLRLLRRLIRVETRRTKKAMVYDLDYDVQLNEAIKVLTK